MVNSQFPRWRTVSSFVFSVLGIFCLGSTSLAQSLPQKKQMTPAKSSAAKSLAVSAEKYFISGQYINAIRFAAAHLKRFPGHKPSILLIARSYYRLGRSPQAVNAFARLELSDLNADAVVEFTLAAFSAKKYKVSAVLWQRLPDNHPYKDIAKFYAGVSYLSLRQYPKASALLRSAKRLPSNLRADRRRLLDEVDELMERERGGLFAPERAYSYQSQVRAYPPQLNLPSASPAPGQPSPPTDSKTTSSAPSSPSEGFMATATPTFSYEITSQSIDRNGYVLEQLDSRKPTAAVPISLKYLARPTSFGGQSSFTLNVTPGYDDIETNTSKSELLASEDSPDIVQNQVTLVAGHFYNQTLNANAEFFFPVSDPLDLVFTYRSDRTFVSASGKKEESKEGPTLKVVGEGDPFKLDVSYSSIETQNKANALVNAPIKVDTTSTVIGTLTQNGESSVTKLEGSSVEVNSISKTGLKSALFVKLNWDKSLGDFGLGIGGTYGSRTPYPESIITSSADRQVPRGEQGGSGSIKWSLDFGLTLTGSITYTMLTDFDYATGTGETFEVFPSNGSATAYSVLASAPIFGSFGGVEATYRYIDRVLTPGESASEEIKAAILKKYWSQLTTTSVKLTLRYPL